MRLGTIVSIGASAVLGIGALLIARLWIPSHAPHPISSAQAATAVVEASVVVAAKPIPWGAKLDGQFLKVIKMPAGDVPQGAYSNVGLILNQDGGPPIALSAMAEQEPVLPSKLSGPGERQTLAALVDPGMRAYTIGVTAVSAGGGHILPGDRIDVVLTRDLDPGGQPNATGGGRKMITSVVIQNVRVLGMDLNANPTSTTPAVASTATLEVTMTDAEKLALASQNGTLSLALRRPGAVDIAPIRPMLVNDLGPVGGSAPHHDAASAPRHPKASHSDALPRIDTGASVTVVNGDTASSLKVPFESASAGL